MRLLCSRYQASHALLNVLRSNPEVFSVPLDWSSVFQGANNFPYFSITHRFLEFAFSLITVKILNTNHGVQKHWVLAVDNCSSNLMVQSVFNWSNSLFIQAVLLYLPDKDGIEALLRDNVLHPFHPSILARHFTIKIHKAGQEQLTIGILIHPHSSLLLPSCHLCVCKWIPKECAPWRADLSSQHQTTPKFIHRYRDTGMWLCWKHSSADVVRLAQTLQTAYPQQDRLGQFTEQAFVGAWSQGEIRKPVCSAKDGQPLQ